jgi:hypothetical protein
MTVKELKERLNFLTENGFLNEDDIVLLLGSGDKISGLIENICMPKVKIKYEKNPKGFYQIGFTSTETKGIAE